MNHPGPWHTVGRSGMWIDTVEVVDADGDTVCLRIAKRTGSKDITETLEALCSFPELLEMAKELATTGGSPSLRAKAKALVDKCIRA